MKIIIVISGLLSLLIFVLFFIQLIKRNKGYRTYAALYYTTQVYLINYCE